MIKATELKVDEVRLSATGPDDDAVIVIDGNTDTFDRVFFAKPKTEETEETEDLADFRIVALL